MSYLNKIEKLSDSKQNVIRPFTIFLVNAKTPKKILTDTIMAENYEDAQLMAATKHKNSSILYVRGIGDKKQNNINKPSTHYRDSNYEQFPGARFIKGKFLQATFVDDIILESISDPA